MRIRPGFIMLGIAVALAGCGGSSKKPMIGNAAPDPTVKAWSLDRALTTVPASASAIVRADLSRVRTAEVTAAFLDDAMAELHRMTPDLCDGIELSGEILIVGPEQNNQPFTIWQFGAQTSALRACLGAARSGETTTVTTDGDYIEIVKGGKGAGILLLDDTTVVALFGPATALGHGAVEAAIAERGDPFPRRDLDALIANGKPVWGYLNGGAAPFASVGLRFRAVTLVADVADKVAASVTMTMVEKDMAALVAQQIQQQGQMAVGMGVVSALDAHASADTLLVTVEMTRASIDKLVGLLGSMGAFGGGTSSIPLPGGP
jgi:hypothetical protein